MVSWWQGSLFPTSKPCLQYTGSGEPLHTLQTVTVYIQQTNTQCFQYDIIIGCDHKITANLLENKNNRIKKCDCFGKKSLNVGGDMDFMWSPTSSAELLLFKIYLVLCDPILPLQAQAKLTQLRTENLAVLDAWLQMLDSTFVI